LRRHPVAESPSRLRPVMMASADARMAFFFIQDPPFPQDGLPEGAFPDDLPFLGRVNDHVHANARPQDIGDDIPESLGEAAVRPADDDHVVIAVGQGIPSRPGAEQDDAFGSASGLPSKSEGLRRGPSVPHVGPARAGRLPLGRPGQGADARPPHKGPPSYVAMPPGPPAHRVRRRIDESHRSDRGAAPPAGSGKSESKGG